MASVDNLSIQITASTKSAKDKVDALCASLSRLATSINALDVSKFETLSASVNSLSQGLSGLKGSSVKQVTKMSDALKSVSAESTAFEPIVKGVEQVATEASKAAQGEDQIAEGLKKIDATPLADVSTSMQNVSDSVGETTSRMSGFKSVLASLKIIVPTESLDNVNKKIANLSEKAQELKERLDYKSKNVDGYVDSEQMEKDQQKIQGLINEIDRLKLKKQELESHGGFKLNLQGFENVKNSISKANDKLKGFISHLHRAKSASKDSAKSINSFKEASDRLVKSLTRVTKMLKLMVTRMALRAVIKEVGNGFKSLALHSEEFDNAMSGLINASKQLGYSFAGMVSPLINALAPALVYLINLAIKAVNVFNQLFSILTGKTTWNKAKEFTGKWSDDIKAANKQAKELKKTVLGFDELNQLQEKYTSGGDTSGNIEDMFDTVNTEKKWQDFIDKLINPLKKAWANVGDEVMGAWKRAFENIKKLGADVARDFWKVWEQPETQKIFENILKIFRDIGDFVANITEQLDKAWNKNETGLHILENIRDIIGIIIAGIQRITESWAEWAKTIDFSPLLEAVNQFLASLETPAKAIMGIFEDINKDFIQPLAKWLIETGIPELINVFTEFNDKVQWETIRGRLDRVWKALEPFAKTVGEGLIQFIRDASNAVADFLNSEKWNAFIDTLIKWMKDVKPDDVARGIKIVAGAIITLKGALFLLEGIQKLNTVITSIKTFLGLFSAGGTAAKAAGTIKTLTTALEGWNRAVSGLVGTAALIHVISDIKDTFTLGNLKKELDNGSISVKNFTDKLKDLGGLGRSMGSLSVLDDFSAKAKDLREQLDSGKITLEQYNKAMTDLNKEYAVAPAEMTPLEKEVRQLTSDYAQGILTYTEYHNKLDEAEKKYGSAAESAKSASKTTSDALNTVDTSAKKAETSIKDYQKGVEDSSRTAQLEIHKMGFSIGTDLDGVKKAADDVKKAFDKKNWTFDGVAEGLKKTFEDAKRGIKDVWNSIADKLNGDYEIGEGHMHINLPHFYATGGFPEDGWFRASHGEMLGRFDNGQSVVANNQQITEGIARAVYSAMMSANSGNGGNVPIYTTIQIGEEEVARAVTRGQRKIDRRYSPTTT